MNKDEMIKNVDTMIGMYSLGGFCREVAGKELNSNLHPSLVEELLKKPEQVISSDVFEVNEVMAHADYYKVHSDTFYSWLTKMGNILLKEKSYAQSFFDRIDDKVKWYGFSARLTELEKQILNDVYGLESGVRKSVEQLAKSKPYLCPPSYIRGILDYVYEMLEECDAMNDFLEFADEYRSESIFAV